MLNGLKWIWIAVVAGIPLSLAAATLFQWLTTGKKVLISWQAVTDLLGYWPLNDGAGSTAIDLGALEHHGTIAGGTRIRASAVDTR